MNIKPPTTAAMIADAASTISTMVSKFNELNEAVRVLAMVELAAAERPE